MRAKQIWLYKNRKKGDSSGHRGDWDDIFSGKFTEWSDPDMLVHDWQGTWQFQNPPRSGDFQHPQAGDLIFAQQSDSPRRIVGMVKILACSADSLTLKPWPRFPGRVLLPYRPELRRNKSTEQVAEIRAMGTVRASVFLLSREEAVALARFCGPAAVKILGS